MIPDALDRAVRASIIRLRTDAVERGMVDYAMTLDRAVIRLGMAAIEAEIAQHLGRKPALDP